MTRCTEEMVARQQTMFGKSKGSMPRRIPAQLEHYEQVALFQWAALRITQYPELQRLFAVPNGGYRPPKVAAKMKAEGVKPGVPDVILPAARAGYHGLYLELKVGRNKPSETQVEWITDLENAGYACYVCYGWTVAADIIKAYLDGSPVQGRTHR